MKFNFVDSPTDCVIYPVFNETINKLSIRWCTELHSKRGTVTWVRSEDGLSSKVLLGLGSYAAFKSEMLREAAGTLGRAIEKESFKELSVSLEAFSLDKYPEMIASFTEGWLLGTYNFDRYKQQKKDHNVESISFLTEPGEAAQQALHAAIIRAEGTNWCRDMANEPANQLRPLQVIEQVKERFEHTDIDINVIEGESLEQHQMNGLIAVGKGSEFPPAMLELSYCTDESLPCIALIGKGITFDTGGISLKKSRDMSDMRLDMSGAAAVLGALYIIAKLEKPMNVKLFVPLAENRPSYNSMLPGDIIQYSNGHTVQVGNTDAEGRLVLADAMLRAQSLGITEMIDIATLTGACVVALGDRIAGIWGEEKLLTDIQRAAASSGDKVWPLPLESEYEELLHSHYADFSNISKGSYAGAITAALFLKKFVQGDVNWAHIDMAGPMEATSTKGYIPAGATGFGARLLADVLLQRVEK